MFRRRKKYIYIVVIILVVLYVLPNTLNFRERKYFSEDRRLKGAKELSAKAADSVTIIPGGFYERGDFYTWLFGRKHRDLWTTPVSIPVFNYDTVMGGLVPYEIGGSQQTISIRLRDSAGRHWVLRSVNKDQQNVLPWWLRGSIVRPVFRDQVSAMNPYGAKLVARLAAAAGLPHLNPKLYWMPFEPKYEKYNERMAGRLACLEAHLDSTWLAAPMFGYPQKIVDGEDFLEKEHKKHPVDTMLYLKTRLFDMLVNDWDRHKDQWRWLLVDAGGKQIYQPVGRDRDIAFYIFDEGVINRVAVRANEKFQSFRPQFGSIAGLMKQSKKQDRQILKGVAKQHYIALARQLQQQLDSAAVGAAFREYPPAIYQRVGREHESILASRLKQLPSVAAAFHKLVNDD